MKKANKTIIKTTDMIQKLNIEELPQLKELEDFLKVNVSPIVKQVILERVRQLIFLELKIRK